VASFKIFDRAYEFRIEIIGRFTGEGVVDVREAWEQALQEAMPRRLSIDISRLNGYDASGRRLLADMYRHGTEFAARTAASLVFLSEIANTPRAVSLGPVRRPQKANVPVALRAASGQ
jgi:ABC-type transporter Mla MlaB component